MPYATYPTAEHIEAFLKSNSTWPTDADKQAMAQYIAGIVADACAAEWERIVGWKPFLSTGESETRRFYEIDSRGVLQLGAAQSIATVQIGTATPLIADESYWLEPDNATTAGYISGLVLGDGWGYYGATISRRSPIAITGVFGRVTEVPGDVFLALLKRAGAVMMDLIENQQSVASISQDGFSKAYDIVGIRTQKDFAETGDKDFLLIAGRWMRPVV